jgi:hypothetical protein
VNLNVNFIELISIFFSFNCRILSKNVDFKKLMLYELGAFLLRLWYVLGNRELFKITHWW